MISLDQYSMEAILPDLVVVLNNDCHTVNMVLVSNHLTSNFDYRSGSRKGQLLEEILTEKSFRLQVSPIPA